MSKVPSAGKKKRKPNKPKQNLSAAYVEKVKPKGEAFEVSDTGARGLILLVHQSGAKSWIMRFRRPSGKHAKLTLGSYYMDGSPGVP
ncbi:MAG: hypothetical protein GEV13_13280, partial [Rhodospirillales bacterium]|nr:hypothetical protein [Rhodospirillales bacterium]